MHPLAPYPFLDRLRSLVAITAQSLKIVHWDEQSREVRKKNQKSG